MTLPLTLIVEPDGADFRTRPDSRGRVGALRLAEAGLPVLAEHFDRVLGLPSTGPVAARLLAALAALAERGEIQDAFVSNHDQIAPHCRRAGLPTPTSSTPGTGTART